MTVASNTPYNQYTATGGQTVFNYTFEIVENTDLAVYQRAGTDEPNDIADLLTFNVDYTVTGVGNENGGTVVLNVGAALNDIVTIKQNIPIQRDTSFTPGGVLRAEDLNSEFDNQTLTQQVTRFNEGFRMLRYYNSAIVEPVVDTIIPVLGANQIWGKNADNDEIIAIDIPEGGGFAPANAEYWLATPNPNLSEAYDLSSLGTGFLGVMAGTGAPFRRTLTAVANAIFITNPNGAAGNPIFGFVDNPTIPGHEGLQLPVGTTAQRPGAPSGTNIRHNTTLGLLEWWNGSDWFQLDQTPGATSVEGTENQVLVNGTFGTPETGNLILTLPQDIAPTSNIEGNNFLPGYTATETAGGTTTLNVNSANQQFFTGTLNQTIQLPVASTLVLGQSWRIVNRSTGNLTIQTSGGNTLTVLFPNAATQVTCVLTSGTGVASWSFTSIANTGQWNLIAPIFSFVTPGDLSVVYGTQLCRSVHVGNRIYYSVNLSFTPTYTTSASTAFVQLVGLQTSNASAPPMLGSVAFSNVVFAANSLISANVQPGNNLIVFPRSNSGASFANLGTAAFPSGGTYTIIATGYYFV